MSDRPAGAAPSRLRAALGPTNTGKTHLAVERMLGHASGMIGLPLRLLAREIYDRAIKLRGASSVALVTGEEKIIPPRAVYFVCTVEAMPVARSVEFLAVDEIQLMEDRERGHVFTERLLHARGQFETMFMGSLSAAPLLRRLAPGIEIETRERLSTLSYTGSKKLTRLPRRTAVVAFSAERVYAVAELLRRQKGGAAVVMGALSPRTRNAQVALYQSGEVDYLVATDAIGMGLNMDVDHVAFAALNKFDGKRNRALFAPEVGQIAGRAGRYRRDGTFGVTAEAGEIDPDLVEAVESHHYPPLLTAKWRNSALDFSSLHNLLRSLAEPAPREGLSLTDEALDETTLRALAKDEEVARRAKSRDALFRLWEAAQIPEFRKTTFDEHLRLARTVFDALTSRAGRLNDDFLHEQFRGLDRSDGDIDALAGRLAGVRTLSYAANRPDWVQDPAQWQGLTRGLEDRLSDALHERLTARFVDRRTSVLMKALGAKADLASFVAPDGAVKVEGHSVGRLIGLEFVPERSEGLADRALRGAARAAVIPEIIRRLRKLAEADFSSLKLTGDGTLLWNEVKVGQLLPGDPLTPRVRLPETAQEQAGADAAHRRLMQFVRREAATRLPGLFALKSGIERGLFAGTLRGLAHRLIENAGALSRLEAPEAFGLSGADRAALKLSGVRIGLFALYAEEVAAAEARAYWRLASGNPARALGHIHASGQVYPVEALEALGKVLRKGKGTLTHDDLARAGWSEAAARTALSVLRWRQDKTTLIWSPRPAPRPANQTTPDTPFAALSALKASPSKSKHRRKKPVQGAA